MFIVRTLLTLNLRRKYFLIYLLLSSALFFVSCHSGKNKNADRGSVEIIELPPLTPVSAADSVRIQNDCNNWYNKVLRSTGFNGGMIVAKNGHIIFERYNGTAHLPGNDTINENTSMHIASVSKTFTAMAILKLWQDGKLNIDDPVSKYFPSFSYPDVTIRSLLSHRSGLPNYVHYMDQLKWDKNKMVTNNDVLQTLTDTQYRVPPASSPNSKFNYCNTNYALLALIIENVSGKKYAAFINETFFIPLQMKHSFVFNMSDTGKVPMSYDWRERLMPLNMLDEVYGDKNIYTTPRDLLIWDRALYSGKIFKPETLAQAFAPYSNERPGIKNYGLGWRMNIYPNRKKIIYHNGWWHGSNAVFIRLIQDSSTIILIGNKYNRGIYHAKDLANIFANYYSSSDYDEPDNSKPSEENTVPTEATDINNEEPVSYRDSYLKEVLETKKKK